MRSKPSNSRWIGLVPPVRSAIGKGDHATLSPASRSASLKAPRELVSHPNCTQLPGVHPDVDAIGVPFDMPKADDNSWLRIPAVCIQRSGMTGNPVLQLEARDALEFAVVVGNKSEPRGFGVSGDPQIVAADHLAAFL